jgi:hypothetical protein
VVREPHPFQAMALGELKVARLAVIRANGYLAALLREIGRERAFEREDEAVAHSIEQAEIQANQARELDERLHMLRRSIGKTPLGGRIG